MSIKGFLRERAKGVADNVVAALLYAGGAIAMGWLTKYIMVFYGFDERMAWVVAWAVGLLIAVALSLLLKPKQGTSTETEGRAITNNPQQTLTQSGVVVAPHIESNPHNEFKPHNEFSPTLVVQMPPAQPQPATERARTNNPPIIEARPGQIVKTKIDARTLEVANLHTAHYGERPELVEVWVAFAKFYRDVDGSEDSWIEVRAYAEFLDARGDSLFIADALFWWQKEGEHSASETFRVGDTGRLIVAIIGSHVYPYSGNYVTVARHGIHDVTDFVLETRDNPLQGSEFLVRIVLIGTKGGRQILKQSFDYDLATHPKAAFSLRKAKPDVPTLAVQEPPPITSSERIFVDVTPDYLMDFYNEKYTALQSSNLAAPFRGKWMKISGVIDNIEGTRQHSTVRFKITKPDKTRWISLYFYEEWADRLSVLQRGDEITAVGKIHDLFNNKLSLDKCELVDS